MKLNSNIRAILLSTLLCSLVLPSVFATAVAAQMQDAAVALQRGYRTGYSDGYMAGYRDTIDSLAKNLARHDDYTKADRSYNKDFGTIEDYRDGYQQGFERGYDTGFEKRTFEPTLPTDLTKRGIVLMAAETNAVIPDSSAAENRTVMSPTSTNSTQIPATVENTATGFQSGSNAIIVIPRDTELVLELQEDLSTERSRAGEKFTAKIVSPSEIAGATIEGRISKITQPGRIKRRSELSLSFDRIILNDTRWSNFGATLTEVMPVKGDNIKLVDTEGTAIGKSTVKSDATKIGGATGAGLVVGAIVGGPVGAAVGAGMGAAFGVGAVVIERGKHIRLNRNQQLRIKTAYETQIR